MRTLLVCCLAVVALANANSQLPKPFKGQQTYVYRFDTQIASSLVGASPAEIQQAAATRLRADALLTFTNDRHAKLQLQHIRVGEMNAELPKSQRVQPLEHFDRKEVSPELKQTLEMPLSVSYVDGVVERINFHEDDSTWSKNIKRAVLNMLQLNLKRNDVQGLKMQSSMPQEDKEVPVFSLPEITLEGECESVYTIQKQQRYGQDEDERTPFNVTKTLNFNKCQRTADVSFGYQPNPAEQLRCLNCLRQQKQQQQNAQQREEARFAQCQQECQPSKINEDKDVERSTFARFELVGKPEKYAIKRTSMMSQYIVKAQNPSSQNTLIQVVALSELTFKEQLEGSQQKVPSFKQSTTDETLMYTNEWDVKEKRFYMFGEEEFEKASPFEKVQKKEQKAAHAIRSILRQWSDKKQGYELDSALNYQRLVETIRKCTVKEIKQIQQVISQVAQDHEGEQPERSQKMAMTLFHDALASAATRNSLFVLAEKIMKAEISTPKAVQLLKSFTTNQHSPSQAQADILEKIAKHEVSHRSPVLKQTAWLSFGQAVGAICQDKPAEGQKEMFRVEEICPRGKKEQYKKTLMSQWQKSESIYEQILALKTIGNAALDNTIDELQKIVKDKEQPTLVRMEAIDALRRLRTSMPQKIRQVLLPIFQNQREEPEIRMAAFSMILYTHPEKSVLDQLTFTTINDRSQNVKSFVLTAMESLSKSPSSAEQEIANHLKASLKMIKMEPEELRSSRKYRVPIYVSEQENTEEQNLFASVASIVSPTNMLPIHLSTSLRSAFNGEATEENMQISISQKNLEQWLERINEYIRQYADANEEEKESMERRNMKDLRSIYSSLGIKNRRTGSYYLSAEESDEEPMKSSSSKVNGNQPFGMICLRTNDVDTTIVPIDEQMMPEIVRKMLKGEKPRIMSHFDELSQRLAAGQHFQEHLGMIVGEKRSKIPTTSGLPLALTRLVSGVGSVQGELKLRFESESLSSQRGLTAELRLRASAIATHMHKCEIWSPVLVSGVETVRTVELNGPIALKLRADSKKAELKLDLPQEHRVRIAALHTLPVTFTRQFDMQSRTQREPRVKTVHNYALEHTQREHHESQYQGQVIQLEGHYHKVSSIKQFIQALYSTENNVHVFYNPTERAPKQLTLRVMSTLFEKHPEHSRPELDSFYPSQRGFKHIYEEDYEGMELEKDEARRSRLSTYSQQYNGKDSFKHQLRAELEAHCGDKTHKASVELKGACDAKLKHCKLYVDAERTPLHTENQKWTMSAKIQTVAPEIVSEDEEPTSKQSRMLIQVDSEWGSDKRNQMNVRIQAEPTRKTYWKPNSQQKWSRFLNKIDLVAEYKLTGYQKQVLKRVYELVKAKYFWTMSVEDHRSNEEGLVRATIIVDPITRKHANVSVQTPTERLRIQQIELPIRMSAYSLERRHPNVRSVGHLIESVTQFGGAECKANERRLETFDGVSYRAPMTECWNVLAKDCSRDEPRFVVLMKKTENKKIVKIVNQDKTIELISTQQQAPIVKIDGKQVQDEQELLEEGVELSYSQAYVRQSGVNVQFDGEEAKIKVSGMYKNLQCGLCGHYNDEEEDVFRMGNGQRSSSLKQFHRSYQLKNEQCDETKLNKHYENSHEFEIERRQQRRPKQQRGWFESSESKDSDEDYYGQKSDEEQSSYEQGRKKSPKPIKRTKIIEYQHRLCFSTQPVKKCPRNSQPDENAEQKKINVEFFCLDRTSSEARRLQRQVRNGEQIEAEGRAPSFTEQLKEPTKCQSIY